MSLQDGRSRVAAATPGASGGWRRRNSGKITSRFGVVADVGRASARLWRARRAQARPTLANKEAVFRQVQGCGAPSKGLRVCARPVSKRNELQPKCIRYRMPTLICSRVTFYSRGDEFAFFTWLDKVKAIRSVAGSGDSIHIQVPRRVSDVGLRELLAIFHRYHINMRQLAQFESESNRKWFADPQRHWHRKVFPATSPRHHS